MTDSDQVTSVQVNKMANVAFWASVVNIVSWLLGAIPGFLLTPLSTVLIVTVPFGAIIAFVAGIVGMHRVERYGTGTWQSITGIVVGSLNLPLIGIILLGISAMVNCC